MRTGDWEDQVIPTVIKIEDAIREGRLDDAAQLIDYFMEEARVVQAIYSVWYPGFQERLVEQGVGREELDAPIDRLSRLMAMPDGPPFDPFGPWGDLGARAGRLGNLVRSGGVGEDEAIAEMDEVRENWCRIHDRWVDFISGILTFGAERFGEASLEDMYRHTLEPYIRERYMVYDLPEHDYVDTIFRNLYTTIEAMRAHLGGLDRRGEMVSKNSMAAGW